MPATEHRLMFPPTLAGFEEGARALRDCLATRQFSDDVRYNVEMAFEEVATNIIRHGHATGEIKATIRFDPDDIMVAFEDDGVPFDPRERPDVILPSSLDEAPVGGLGLTLLRSVLRRMEYERTPQEHNLLTLVIAAR